MLAAFSSFSSSSAAYAGAPVVQGRAALRTSPRMGTNVEDMLGKYSVKETVYDPLNLASKYDVNWLREAELKHGRVCMLAVSGFLAVDGGIRFPGAAFEGISAVEAHDAMVKSGHMWSLLGIVGFFEFLHFLRIIPLLDTDWEGVRPGDYGLDPFNMDNESRRISELKNGRLAMLGFSGLVTQAALGHAGYWA